MKVTISTIILTVPEDLHNVARRLLKQLCHKHVDNHMDELSSDQLQNSSSHHHPGGNFGNDAIIHSLIRLKLLRPLNILSNLLQRLTSVSESQAHQLFLHILNLLPGNVNISRLTLEPVQWAVWA